VTRLASRKLLREYARYFLNNGCSPAALRRFVPALIRTAYRFGYIHWPKHLQRHVKTRDVLDVGCGMGLHGVGFVLSGVHSYTGCDPMLDLGSEVIKNKGSGKREPCGWTLGAMMQQLPQLHYVRGGIDDVAPGALFDVVTLHNATEHLIEIDQVFASVANRLKPGGLLIFNHHNFYAWNGHHLAPKNIASIDRSNAAQRKVIDWAHLDADAELSSYLSTRVNRITLDALRTLTQQEFEIEEWRETLSNETEGGARLTDEILARHPQFTRRDLETQSVYCVARKRNDHEAASSQLVRQGDRPAAAR
jgi:SAM-dependent methyltransferase